MFSYRDRIYRNYVHARNQPLAPASIEGFKPRAPYLIKLIRDHFPVDKNVKILELGCGHGALIFFAQKEGYRKISGIDRSPQQVAEARHLGIEGICEGDLMQFLRDQSDESIDTVVAFDVIEHLTRDELLPLVDEVYRVLRNGGKWIIHTLNGESPFCTRMLYNDVTHEWAFTRQSIAQILKSSGYSNVICREDAPIPHGFKSMIRWIFWKMIRNVLRFYMAVETGYWDRDSIFSQGFLVVTVK